MAPLELYGRQVAGGVVTTPGVIEHLDVVEDICPGLIARRNRSFGECALA